MKLMHALGDEAAGPGGVTRASSFAGALREISVGLCKGLLRHIPCVFGDVCQVQWDGVPGGHKCAHG
jgi:hypothetical protein